VLGDRRAGWFDVVGRRGVRGGVDRHRHRLGDACAVLRELPAVFEEELGGELLAAMRSQ
jgi:hypothetical protein